MYKNIRYFNGLNALRFFAAYFVVLHHAEQIRMKYGLFHLKSLSIFNNGGLAVTFFFVLSGFLINYLLISNIWGGGKISVKKFYMRRILRIWPLYYLLVIIGTLIIPVLLHFIDFQYEMPYQFHQVILYYVFFFPFCVNILWGHHLLEPLWSIGVEEVFYLWLAPVLKFFHKHILVILGSVIAIKIVLLTLLQYIETPPMVSGVIGSLQFEAMAAGGLVAYFVFHRKKEIASNILFSKPVQMIIFALLFLRLCCCHFLTVHSVVFRFLFFTPVFSDMLFILLFAWLIVNISLNRKRLISLENQFLNFGGGISYGIYMWHMLVIFGMVLLCKNRFNNMNNTVSSIVFYVVLTVCVLAVSYLSKRFFEDKFLRLKNRYY